MTKTKSARLLRCPFCGGKPALVSVANGYFVACTQCPAQTGSYSHTFTREAAITSWNRRPGKLKTPEDIAGSTT